MIFVYLYRTYIVLDELSAPKWNIGKLKLYMGIVEHVYADIPQVNFQVDFYLHHTVECLS